MVDMNDIRWIATMLEGEGSFFANKCSRKNKALRAFKLNILSTDKDIIERASRLLNGGHFHTDLSQLIQRGHKPRYYFSITGPKAIGWMMTVYSLMGKRRRAKIKGVVQEWRVYNGYINRYKPIVSEVANV